MKNTLIIILAILFILAGSWYVFKPKEPSDSEQQLIQDKEKLQQEFSKIEEKYKIKEKELAYKEAELLKAKVVVKRSEEKLSELLKRERYAQIENKRLIERYSNYQLDSAFMALYPVPDSVHN